MTDSEYIERSTWVEIGTILFYECLHFRRPRRLSELVQTGDFHLGNKLIWGLVRYILCIGCGVCVQSCMNDVLRMKRGKAYIAYQADCSQCFSCVIDCPSDAISMGWVDYEELYPGNG